MLSAMLRSKSRSALERPQIISRGMWGRAGSNGRPLACKTFAPERHARLRIRSSGVGVIPTVVRCLNGSTTRSRAVAAHMLWATCERLGMATLCVTGLTVTVLASDRKG
jgi:hypothetical protein